MTYKQLILHWVELFNAANDQALTNLYTEKAIIHQTPIGFIEGRENIRKMFQDEFNQFNMVCLVEELHEDNGVCILEWKDPKGLRGCSIFWIKDNHIAYQRGYWDNVQFQQQQAV